MAFQLFILMSFVKVSSMSSLLCADKIMYYSVVVALK